MKEEELIQSCSKCEHEIVNNYFKHKPFLTKDCNAGRIHSTNESNNCPSFKPKT